MLKGILWDNDGVLVDTEHLYYLSNKELLSEYNLDLTESDYFEWYLMRQHRLLAPARRNRPDQRGPAAHPQAPQRHIHTQTG